MKLAYIGLNIHAPSHLWMRRMLDILNKRVVIVIDKHGSKPPANLHGARYSQYPARPSLLMRCKDRITRRESSWHSYLDKWLTKEIRDADCDGVLCHYLSQGIRFRDTWKELDLPVQVHCHGWDITWDMKFPNSGLPVHDEAYLNAARQLPENVTFVANSTFTAGKLEQIGIAPARIRIKQFGLVAPNEKPVTVDRPPVILFLGRLVDFKGPLETLQAFSKVVAQYPDARLRIAGDGILMDKVKQSRNVLGLEDRTEILGAVDSQGAVRERSQASIFTAHNCKGNATGQEEAFGVSLLEAMACGLPVVTGRSGGVADFIHHEQNGFLFEPGDVEAHADLLLQLLRNSRLREQIGENAWLYVKEKHTPEQELTCMESLFDTIMK